jgi:hypothetical protein
MPDPRGVKRLLMIGCDISFAKSELKVPVEIKNYDDFVPGTRYPKMHNRPVWFVQITIPKDLMNNIKEGTIDLADQTIDLQEIEDAYAEDLDKENLQDQEDTSDQQPNPAGNVPISPVTF